MNTKNRPTIDQENIEDILPLTPVQEGMLFHYLKNGSREYLEQLVLTLEGEVNQEFLVRSWESLTETNEVLRTVFRWDKNKNPVQIVLKQHEIPFREVDYSLDEHTNYALTVTLETFEELSSK